MEVGRARDPGRAATPGGTTVTRVAGWWRAWIERRIPLMEPEPSRVDLLDGVGLTPVSEQDEPETAAEAAESPDSAESTASDERRLTPDA